MSDTTSTSPRNAQPDRVAYLPRTDVPADGHETVTLAKLSERIAALLGCGFAGVLDDASRPTGERLYLVPADTLTAQRARELGIHDTADLFGGVVPHRFIATKLISHPAIDAGHVPDGWSRLLAQRLGDTLLPGFAVFDAASAHEGLRRLRCAGPLRLKLARGVGGKGQFMVEDAAALDDALAQLPPDELEQHGATLEQHLDEECTFSVGEAVLGGQRIAYVGTQRTVPDRNGEPSYGGSTLRVVRGGFDALLERTDDAQERRAVEHARSFDAAVNEAYPGLLASRRNYDVIAGSDPDGRPRLGVLEQSWRIGGATPAELGAFEAFARDPDLVEVVAACYEEHALVDAPDDAVVHYRDHEPRLGPLTKYSRIERRADAR